MTRQRYLIAPAMGDFAESAVFEIGRRDATRDASLGRCYDSKPGLLRWTQGAKARRIQTGVRQFAGHPDEPARGDRGPLTIGIRGAQRDGTTVRAGQRCEKVASLLGALPRSSAKRIRVANRKEWIASGRRRKRPLAHSQYVNPIEGESRDRGDGLDEDALAKAAGRNTSTIQSRFERGN